MAYHFKEGESLEAGARRIASEQIDDALEAIAHSHGDPEPAIHEVRKKCKKLRALVRLFRDEFGKSQYQFENHFFRDIARKYSDRRDKVALAEAIDDLLSEEQGDQIRQVLEKLRINVCDHYIASLPAGRPDGFKEVEDLFREAKKRCSSWRISGNKFSVLKPSLKRVYRRGCETFSAAAKNPEIENMHEWRKRAKYLWYHYRLLNRIWPPILSSISDEQHRLTSLLGYERDLRILAGTMHGNEVLISSEDHRRILKSFIKTRREELLESIWPLGRRLYAEKPKHFAKRLKQYYKP